MRGSPVLDRPQTTSVADFAGASFPFRDLVVARTYDSRADAAAMRAARALSERMPSVVIVRCEEDALEREVRHAALVLVGRPDRRRPATRPGGDASAPARRLRGGQRDTTTVVAAGAVARHVTRRADRPVLVCPADVDPALALGADRP